MHRIEVQNDLGQAMWKGQIGNDSKGFTKVLEKFTLLEKSNSQSIGAVFMNPTGNYHAPLKFFLESNGYRVILVDARVSEHIRMTQNLGKEKSDNADASILASTARLKPSVLKSGNHERSVLSGLTRLMESIGENIRRITNQIKSDLAAVFPEYPYYENIDTATSLEVLGKYTTPGVIKIKTVDEIASTISKASRNHYDREEAEYLIRAARESIGFPDTDGIFAYRIRMNVARLREEKENLKAIRKEVAMRSSNNEDIDCISAIRGMSIISAAEIVSEIGEIKQFDSAVKLQSYGGKSPDIKGSGGKAGATGASKIRNSHLSHVTYESAVSLVIVKDICIYPLS